MRDDWGKMAGLLQSFWPNLTTTDLRTIQGDRAALARALQIQYALSGHQAEHAICAFEKDVRFPGAVK
jgi:hypothetical protein